MESRHTYLVIIITLYCLLPMWIQMRLLIIRDTCNPYLIALFEADILAFSVKWENLQNKFL